MSGGVAATQGARGRYVGAHPALLRLTYLTTIRPVLDYAAGLYGPGTQKMWKMLRGVQNSALKIILGAMPSTTLPSLAVEGGVLPLELCATELVSRCIARWGCKRGHPVIDGLRHISRPGWVHPYFGRKPPPILSAFASLPVAEPQHGA